MNIFTNLRRLAILPGAAAILLASAAAASAASPATHTAHKASISTTSSAIVATSVLAQTPYHSFDRTHAIDGTLTLSWDTLSDGTHCFSAESDATVTSPSEPLIANTQLSASQFFGPSVTTQVNTFLFSSPSFADISTACVPTNGLTPISASVTVTAHFADGTATTVSASALGDPPVS